MFERYARLLVRRPVAWAVVALTVALAVFGGVWGVEVRQDDDVLAFLPPGNPDIAAFNAINETFGATDVALVGVAVPDVFDADVLQRLTDLSQTLRDTPGLDASITLASLADFRKDPVAGGIVTGRLVEEVPRTPEAREALRAAVMAKDHVLGTFVTADSRATLIYAFGAPGAPPREVAERVRGAVRAHFPDGELFWGGAPFISTWIYETTQADMARLLPWAVLAIIVTMLAAFRDVVGAGLGLLSTAVGISVSRAAMAVLDVPFNIVLSAMPVILFAVGSAYAIHILSHYNQHARRLGAGDEAVVATLAGTGPTTLAAGLTTVAGLLSFVTMDIAPMRTFGVFTAVGLTVALVLSLTFVPAVLTLFPRPVRAPVGGPLEPAMRALTAGALRHRGLWGGLTAAVAAAGLALAVNVDTRMDLSAFFQDDTEPARATAFLDERFGGSTYLQLQVQGDLTQPGVLRELRRLGDRIARVPDVTGVTSVADAMALIHDAFADARRLPDTQGQAAALYRFLASDPAVSRLVTEARDAALVQVRIGTTDQDRVDAVLAAVEAMVVDEALTSFGVVEGEAAREPLRAAVATHVARLLELPEADVLSALAHPAVREAAAAEAGVVARVAGFLTSEESYVAVSAAEAAAVGRAVAALGVAPAPEALDAALAAALGTADDPRLLDLPVVLDGVLETAWRAGLARGRAEALLAALGASDSPVAARVAAVLEELDAPSTAVPAADVAGAPPQRLRWTVSGMPVLYRGLSRSVTANQIKSLAMALGLVVVILSVLFRSFFTGLLATAPTALTLAVVYGGMGLLGVHLDIGTSMLASIIIGAGVDYAVHLVTSWRAPEDAPLADAAAEAVADTSHAIWTNAIMVAAGFFVLTLGDARPLQNVGGLTSAAMLTAALATFLVIPLLARRRAYVAARPLEPHPALSPEST